MVNWLRLNSFDVVGIHDLRAAKLSLNLRDPESRHCRCHDDDFFQNAVIVPFKSFLHILGRLDRRQIIS
jgi:hypothetical protein